jgi:hypothetical protein
MAVAQNVAGEGVSKELRRKLASAKRGGVSAGADGFTVQNLIEEYKDLKVTSGTTFPQTLTRDLIMRFEVEFS